MRHYDPDQRTIAHVLADKVATIGNRPFLRGQGGMVSYAELDEMTNRYAHGSRTWASAAATTWR